MKCLKPFLAKGFWAPDQRNFSRRFGALYFLYTVDAASWAPAAGLIFLFAVAVISALSGCAVPLNTLAGIHIGFGLLFIVKRPARITLDNILVILQYFMGAALAFSRAAEYAQSSLFFTCVLVVAVFSVAHGLIHFALEELILYPAEFMRFRTMDEEEDRIVEESEEFRRELQSAGKSGVHNNGSFAVVRSIENRDLVR